MNDPSTSEAEDHDEGDHEQDVRVERPDERAQCVTEDQCVDGVIFIEVTRLAHDSDDEHTHEPRNESTQCVSNDFIHVNIIAQRVGDVNCVL